MSIYLEEEPKKKKKDRSEKLKEKKVGLLMEKYKDDQKFQEFLRIHKRNSFEEWNFDSILNVGKEFENQNDEKDRDESKSEDESESESEDDAVEKVALKETVSDLDYLKSMTVKKDQAENEEDEETDKETEKKGTETKEQKEKKKKEPKNEKYFDVKLSNLPFKTKKKDVKNFLKPLKPKSIRVPTKVFILFFINSLSCVS